ncbi:hypothetical protein AB0O22_17085 [Streptomyces sp. NPDC091204]
MSRTHSTLKHAVRAAHSRSMSAHLPRAVEALLLRADASSGPGS